jgi:hypothetical protein
MEKQSQKKRGSNRASHARTRLGLVQLNLCVIRPLELRIHSRPSSTFWNAEMRFLEPLLNQGLSKRVH